MSIDMWEKCTCLSCVQLRRAPPPRALQVELDPHPAAALVVHVLEVAAKTDFFEQSNRELDNISELLLSQVN